MRKHKATDCAVLAIAICTVLAITRRGPITAVHQGAWQRNRVVLVCCAIWALPFFTGMTATKPSESKAIFSHTLSGFLALGMGWYAPATGNWYDAILFENNLQD